MRHQPRSTFWRRTIDRLPTLASTRPAWVIAAAVLAVALAPGGYSTSGNASGYAIWSVFLVLAGVPAWVGVRWDESDLPLQPLAQAMASVFISFTVVALLGCAFAMFAALISDLRP